MSQIKSPTDACIIKCSKIINVVRIIMKYWNLVKENFFPFVTVRTSAGSIHYESLFGETEPILPNENGIMNKTEFGGSARKCSIA